MSAPSHATCYSPVDSFGHYPTPQQVFEQSVRDVESFHVEIAKQRDRVALADHAYLDALRACSTVHNNGITNSVRTSLDTLAREMYQSTAILRKLDDARNEFIARRGLDRGRSA